MPDRQQTVALPDGRALMYAEWGDPAGAPVLMLHGTPGTRLARPPDEGRIADLGLRVVTYDRPGYGGSDRSPGRSVVDVVPDVAALVDHLGLDRFSVGGGSGGGPHALAVAALLADRVERAACQVGVAPVDALGEEWMTGMDPANVTEFGWARAGVEVLQPELAREQAEMEARVALDPSTVLGDFELPEADREILGRADIQQLIVEMVREAGRRGVWGWVDDDLALIEPWGFDPATITVPTAVWWGSEDVLVPPSHGAWIAKTVPTAIPRIDTSGGHQADPDVSLIEVLLWLGFGTPWPED